MQEKIAKIMYHAISPFRSIKFENSIEERARLMAASGRVIDAIGAIFVLPGEEPKDGDLFVCDEPTKRNFTQGIPDIVRFDQSYHTVKYDDGTMYVVTGGGTWLEMLRIIERDGKPVITLEEKTNDE